MSPFERYAWRWYQDHATPLAFEGSLLGRALDRLGMGEVEERIFIKALNMIRQFVLKIQAADAGN